MAGFTVQNVSSPVRDERNCLPSLAGLGILNALFPAINGWAIVEDIIILKRPCTHSTPA
jgi:hypothetical protein